MKRKKRSWSDSIKLLGLLLIFACGCDKEDILRTTPIIKAAEIFSISSNAVTIRSKLVGEGSLELTTQGICWSSSPSPTTDDNLQTGDLKDSTIFCRITELTPSTKYYARIYATNNTGTAYSNEISFTTNNTITDIDGNLYNTVIIGTQVWMVENLKTTRYDDGMAIPLITDNAAWANLSTAVYCWYDNSIANRNIYGALYNWPSVSTGKFCPKGWHVPTDTEWTTLTDYLGGEGIAGELLKETGSSWDSPNYIANNYSGFSALPGGGASSGTPTFARIGFSGIWWTSTINDYDMNIYRQIFSDNKLILRNGFVTRTNAQNGLSIRCIKD